MNLTTYENAQAFLARTQAMLERREAANNLILGLARRLAGGTPWPGGEPYFVTVDDGGALVLVGLRTPPNKLILYGEGDVPHDAYALVADAPQARGDTLPGVLGLPDLAAGFAAVYAERAGVVARPGMRQRIYELRQVEYRPAVPGVMRPATVEDEDLVTGWLYAFDAEALASGMTEAQAREAAQRRIAAGELFIWEDGGPVSMAGKSRPLPHGIVVNAVYTPPVLRGRGYASAVVAALSQALLDSGYQFCCLHTDLANPTSNSIYQRIGYHPIADFNEIIFTVSA